MTSASEDRVGSDPDFSIAVTPGLVLRTSKKTDVSATSNLATTLGIHLIISRTINVVWLAIR